MNAEVYHCRMAALNFYVTPGYITGAQEDWASQKESAEESDIDEDALALSGLIINERAMARVERASTPPLGIMREAGE